MKILYQVTLEYNANTDAYLLPGEGEVAEFELPASNLDNSPGYFFSKVVSLYCAHLLAAII